MIRPCKRHMGADNLHIPVHGPPAGVCRAFLYQVKPLLFHSDSSTYPYPP